ncbi:MAG: hypothetical protein ACJZ2I_12195 [Thalassobaculaceae bacterium]|jgi:hypothetical protein|nr:MAG: hypothetical protein CBC15_00525 [Candidatus Endolissoclinum sp. TMED55]|tara:strand:+ start:4835 stop:5452 length:618 start_codon:yes stop_codon:yes gene_type:complete
MTVISMRKMTPTVGKTELATSRVRAMAGIVARAGARVRIGQVVAGEGAGSMHLYAAFEDFSSISRATLTIASDPARATLLHERELNPAGEVVGPEVYRTIYGDVAPNYPIVMQREYRLPRENLQDALSLLPEIEKLGKSHDFKMMAVVPVIADDLGRMVVAYYNKTMEDLGKTIDEVGMSEKFQKIVTKANTFGTLEKSRVVKII